MSTITKASDIINTIDFVNQYKSIKPNTVTGKLIFEKTMKVLNENEISPLMVSNIINESFTSNDDSLHTFSNNMVEAINESGEIKFKVGVILNLIESQADATKMLVPVVSVLNYMEKLNESEIQKFIEDGGLKSHTWFNPIKELHKTFYKNDNLILESENYIGYSPIAYTEINNTGTHFRLDGINFMINEAMDIAICDNNVTPKFNKINEAIESIPYDPLLEQFHVKTVLGHISIDMNGDAFINEAYVTQEVLKESLNKAISYSKLDYNTLNAQAKIGDQLMLILENFDDIMRLDSFFVAKNSMINESVIFSNVGDKSFIFTKDSRGRFSANEYTSINEAIDIFKDKTYIDITENYAELVNDEIIMKESQISHTAIEISELEDLINESITAQAYCDLNSDQYIALGEVINEAQNRIEEILTESKGKKKSANANTILELVKNNIDYIHAQSKMEIDLPADVVAALSQPSREAAIKALEVASKSNKMSMAQIYSRLYAAVKAVRK